VTTHLRVTVPTRYTPPNPRRVLVELAGHHQGLTRRINWLALEFIRYHYDGPSVAVPRSLRRYLGARIWGSQ
jgi:hypothetical protein